MANLPISGFPTGGTIAQAGDEFVIARSGANYKLTSSSISSFVLGGPTTQLGAADVASGAVAQTLQVQSNTGAATTGPNFTIKGSSGTTAGGSIIFQTHNGTAYGNALTIASDKSANFGSTIKLNSSATYLQNGNDGGAGEQSFWFIVNSSATASLVSNGLRMRSTTYLSWSSSTIDGSSDTFLYRDGQPNTLALKNAGNAQIFRAYSTTTGPSYGYFASGVTDAGVAAADTLFIGTGGAGAAMTKLALVVNGTSALSFSGVDATFPGALVSITKANAASSDPTLSLAGDFGNSAQLIVARNGSSSGYPAHSFNLQLNGSSDGFIIRDNNIFRFSFTRAGLFRIGGTTSSFPALKYSSTGVPLQVRLADDSGDAALQCGTQTAGGTAFNVNGTGGNSIASVTNTTTGTLLQVLNSTSNPLMTVTDTTSGTLFSVQSTTAATLFSVNDTTSGTLLAVTNSSATDVFTVSDAGFLAVSANGGIINNGNFILGGSNSTILLGVNNISGNDTGCFDSSSAVFKVKSSGAFGWTSAAYSNTNPDVILYRDDVGILAQRRTNTAGPTTYPQVFRVYSSYIDASNNAYGGIASARNLDGSSGDANTLYIGSQKAGSPNNELTKLALVVNGTTRLDYNVSSASNWTASGTMKAQAFEATNSDFKAPSGGYFYWASRAQMKSPADKVMVVEDSAAGPAIIQTKQFTVTNLPAATSYAGAMAFVSDATATTPRSTVAGGGSNKVMVMSDGTNWLIVA